MRDARTERERESEKERGNFTRSSSLRTAEPRKEAGTTGPVALTQRTVEQQSSVKEPRLTGGLFGGAHRQRCDCMVAVGRLGNELMHRGKLPTMELRC